MSTWTGNKIKISVFGQSHSKAIGVTFDGLKAGTAIDFAEVEALLARRRAGSDSFSTPRKEADIPEFVSGIVDGKSCGASITAIIENTNVKSSDYEKTKNLVRPSHADYAAHIKFGENYDYHGGGQFSGRMTAPICIAGGIAKGVLKEKGIKICAYVSEIGKKSFGSYEDENFVPEFSGDAFALLSETQKEELSAYFSELRKVGDSVGGIIECVVEGLSVGVGDALFGGLEGKIASLAYGVPAVKCVEFGAGKSIAKMLGSEANDSFFVENGKIYTKTNNNGGINGGISNGMPITFRVAIKPTPSIGLPQNTVDLNTMQNAVLEIKGRHDVCIVPRAVPVIESIAALAILDSIDD